MNEGRTQKILKAMEENKIPQMIISDPVAIFYLTGKWIHPGERMLALYLNVKGNHKLVINKLFPQEKDLGVELVWYDDVEDAVEILSRYVDKDAVMGVDKNWPARFLLRLQELGGGSSFVNASWIVDQVRMIKDEEELDILTTSSLINDKVLAEIFENINGDISELELSRMRYELFAKYGADAYGTNVIFSYGAHCAEAHHVSDDTRLTPGDCIMFDLGAPYGHYCSDQTRTVFYKEVSPEMKKIYHIVLEAHLQASAAIRPGVACSEIDRIARNIITNEGYGSYFTHRTGHGIGLDSHEFPDISLSCSEPLQKGMVFSVEPGIYLPQKGGVRIENLFAVTDDGAVSLNHLPRELKVIG